MQLIAVFRLSPKMRVSCKVVLLEIKQAKHPPKYETWNHYHGKKSHIYTVAVSTFMETVMLLLTGRLMLSW